MPQTINGIGTHYYGKDNHSKRRANCPHCNREVFLESYDTRLYFVLVFIPIIPLERKRIIDECPVCTRHGAVPLAQYNAARDGDLATAREKFETSQTAASALELHALLLVYRLFADAEKFRAEADSLLAKNTDWLTGVAAHLEEVEQGHLAGPYYERALALDPEQPAARAGVAVLRIASGDLETARKLLDFMLTPGVSKQQSIYPLFQLALAYQRKNQHEEAIKLLEHVLEEIPAIGHAPDFRAAMQAAEKALQLEGTSLPLAAPVKPDNSTRNWIVGSVLAVSAIVGLVMLSNAYIRRNRTVHVFNNTQQAAVLQIGDREVRVSKTRDTITLAEGKYHISVKEPLQEEFDLDVSADYFERFSKKPVWLINIGGLATFEKETLHYAVNPQPSRSEFIVGRSIVAQPHVDYAFATAPQTVSIKRGEVITKLRFDVAEEPALTSLARLGAQGGHLDGVLRYAEKRLRFSPDEPKLVLAYVTLASAQNKDAEAETFLAKHLDDKPIRIDWHRAYQELLERADRLDDLRANYDKRLAADPDNGTLLYLRGRLETDPDAAQTLFQAAAEKDPKLSWPHFAMGYRALCQSKFADADKHVSAAIERGFPAADAFEYRRQILLAQKRYPELRQIYEQQSTGGPMPGTALVGLCETLVLSNPRSGVQEATGRWVQWESALMQFNEPEAIAYRKSIAARVFYILNNTERLAETVREIPDTVWSVHLALATGKLTPEPAERLERLITSGWEQLELAIGFALEERWDLAQTWHDKAYASFARGDSEDRQLAKLLAADTFPGTDAMRALNVLPVRGPVLYTTLALRFRSQREAMLKLAGITNFSREPPYLLIERASAAKLSPMQSLTPPPASGKAAEEAK